MHVHQKKFETREFFKSFLDIGVKFHQEARQLDPKLPEWSKIGHVHGDAPKPAASSFSEFCEHGEIPDSEIEKRGYQAGKE